MTFENSFIPKYFRVQVSSNNLGGLAPNNGFIDDKKPHEFDNFPSTVENSYKKERSNIRYEEIIRQMSMTTSPVNNTPSNIDAPGRDENTDPTNFNFTVVFDKPDYLRTEDENNKNTFLTQEDAIKRYVARALTLTLEKNRDILNPTKLNATDLFSNPNIIQNITVGNLASDLSTAETNITVSEIENT